MKSHITNNIYLFLTLLFLKSAKTKISFTKNIHQCENLCMDSFDLLPTTRYSQINCQRGCRFFFVIYVQNNQLNISKLECNNSCKESYVISQERDSCQVGCGLVPLKINTYAEIIFMDEQELLYKNNISNFAQQQDQEVIQEINEIILNERKHELFLKDPNILQLEEKFGRWFICLSKTSKITKVIFYLFLCFTVIATFFIYFPSKKDTDK